MSELANQLLMTSGGPTRLADRLERDGLITRTRCATDQRGFEARLTPAGKKRSPRPTASTWRTSASCSSTT